VGILIPLCAMLIMSCLFGLPLIRLLPGLSSRTQRRLVLVTVSIALLCGLAGSFIGGHGFLWDAALSDWQDREFHLLASQGCPVEPVFMSYDHISAWKSGVNMAGNILFCLGILGVGLSTEYARRMVRRLEGQGGR
jgi:hypothetical protein